MDLQHLTTYCKATADPLRLLILRVLSRESFGVLELCHILDVAQPALSHHLKILSNDSLLETRRQGTSIYYRRALVSECDPIQDLRRSLFTAIDLVELSQEINARTEHIYEERRQQAKTFFEKNSMKLQENQNLIAELPHYLSCITELLANNFSKGKVEAIEVGSGESDLILALSDFCRSVAVIDTSPEMLGRTREKLESTDLKNVALFRGELRDYENSADLIVANMVLHHIPSPANFFFDAFNHLAPGGNLLIADLTSHEQEWTREACGDLWPGFDPEELDQWADASGLKLGQSAYLGLKNGFQVQVRTFIKPD